MNELFRPDKKIIDLLTQERFTVSAEVIPPRNGTPELQILNQIRDLIQAGAEFLSVTKGAGGSLRGGSLPIAQVIKDYYKVPVIAHFTCRDLSAEEVENQLMDHHYFGIRNILGLRGDPPTGVANWQPKTDSYPYAYQLIQQVEKLNLGSFLERKGFSASNTVKTDFCIGAAAYPDDATFEQRIHYFKKKVDAGAAYGITQMLYDSDSYSRFLDDLGKENIMTPIVPGARILKSRSQAERMISKFGIKIPKLYLDSLPESENPEQALDVFLNLVERLKKAGAPGLHVFVLVDTELACKAIKALR